MKYPIASMAILLAIMVLILSWFSPLPSTKARPADGELRQVDDIRYFVQGTGKRAVLLASAGREASDFNELASALISNGYRTLAIEAPGIGGTDIPDGATLYDLGERVKAVLDHDEIGTDRAVIIGHAFGNRVARAFATKHPRYVQAVILVAAGGQRPIEPEVNQKLKNAFDPLQTFNSRHTDIRDAFFAKGNAVPDHWQKGWHTRTAIMQGRTKANTTDMRWHGAGGRPILILQANEDRIAPKADTADILLQSFPEQVNVVIIEKAGHALLPERPGAVARAILDYLQRDGDR